DIWRGKPSAVQGSIFRSFSYIVSGIGKSCWERNLHGETSLSEIALFGLDRLGKVERVIACSVDLSYFFQRFSASIIILCVLAFARAIELTFELPDNANQCFFEDIKAGIDCVIEYQELRKRTWFFPKR
ncbi:unnamed protein product, partial [Onchocerca flexuosa]|uniref:Cyclin N-terminal domain-containing protein n=1 Tax=Onchocerca flexuosa TaxID=387005 RepID=A0A183HSG8_9BILA